MEKVLSKSNLFRIGIWTAVILFSFLPLIINPSSFPPGDDPVRLLKIAKGWDWYYYGYLPIKVTGINLYYYATFLLIFIGLTYFFKNIKLALTTWIILLFMTPAIYLNMVAGAWINIVGIFLIGLITIRLHSDWFSNPWYSWRGMLGMSLAFLAPIFHNEAGGYLALALIPFIIIFRPRRAYAVFPVIIGLIIVVFVFHGRGYQFFQGRRDEVIVFTDPDTGEEVKAGINSVVLEREKFTVVVDEKSYEINPEEVEVAKFGIEYWVNNYLTLSMIIPIIIITTISTVIFSQKSKIEIPKPIWAIALAIPSLAILTFFEAIAFSPTRTGIHLVSFTAILLAYFVVYCWKNSENLQIRWVLVSIFSYLIMINLPNSLGVWIQSRA